jgi:hypothetical protein
VKLRTAQPAALEAIPKQDRVHFGPPVADNLKEAGEKAKELFTALPQSSDRDSVLSALGRLGTLSLKRKIAARVKLISDNTVAFPELAMITEKAVNCRNYFVHGSSNQVCVPKIRFGVDAASGRRKLAS